MKELIKDFCSFVAELWDGTAEDKILAILVFFLVCMISFLVAFVVGLLTVLFIHSPIALLITASSLGLILFLFNFILRIGRKQ